MKSRAYLCVAVVCTLLATSCARQEGQASKEPGEAGASGGKTGGDPTAAVDVVKAYRARVARYLDAARAGAKLLEGKPPETAVKEKEKELKDLLAQVSHVPPEIDTSGKVLQRLNNVQSCFLVAAGFYKQATESERQNPGGGARDILEQVVPATISDLRRFADEVETRVGQLEPSKRVEPSPAEATPPDVANVRAATVRVTTYRANGSVTSANGFFVPGPGLIVTNARTVGLQDQPTKVVSIRVVVGSGTGGARTLEAKLLKDNPGLDLALLQVTALNLPAPPAHGVSAGLNELRDARLVSVLVSGKPAITSPGAVTGRKDVAGPRPWLVLKAALPGGMEGSPVVDRAGRVLGIATFTPDVRLPSAVPIETVEEFVRAAMKSVEAGALIPVGPPLFPGAVDPRPASMPPGAKKGTAYFFGKP